MNFINTKHYDKKRKALLDQDGYTTSDFINKVSDLEPDDDYLLLDQKITNQATAIANSVVQSTVPPLVTSQVDTIISASPLDLVDSQNEYIRLSGSSSSGVTIEAKQTTGDGSTDINYIANGNSGGHRFRTNNVDLHIAILNNRITTRDATYGAQIPIYFEAKGLGSGFGFKVDASATEMYIFPNTAETNIGPSAGDLVIQTYNATKMVKIPSYLSLGGLGYYYGQLPDGATAVAHGTETFPDFSTNVTNTFGSSRIRWQNGLGLHNNTTNTMTLLCRVFWATTYVVAASHHLNVDYWFRSSNTTAGGAYSGVNAKWGRETRHYEEGEYISGTISEVIQLPANSHIRFAIYQTLAGGGTTSIDLYGYDATYGLYVGNNICYFTVQQIA